MLLSSVAALGTIGASIAGAIGSARAARQAQEQAQSERSRMDAYYRTERARPATTRSDYLELLGKQRELLNQQYRRARATDIVAGGSNSQLAMMQSGANDSLAQTTAQIAGNAANRSDSLGAQQAASNNAWGLRQVETLSNQADAIAAAGGQASKAFAGLAAADTNTLADDLAVFGIRKR